MDLTSKTLNRMAMKASEMREEMIKDIEEQQKRVLNNTVHNYRIKSSTFCPSIS